MFSVLGVLSTMIFQIWSYYFSLVRQMDEQTISSPQVLAFAELCDQVKFSWNTVCLKKADTFECKVHDELGRLSYISSIGTADVSNIENVLTISNIVDCVKITVWAIPW